MPDFQIARKAGKLRNGGERGSFRYHAVPYGDDKPLCGERPAISWRSEAGAEVSCPRCLKRLSTIEAVNFVSGAPEDLGF